MRRELFVLILNGWVLGGTSEQDRLRMVPPFFMPSTMIHIGQMIEAELHRQERSVIWFAKKLYCDRTNVYSIFKRQNIDTDLLMRICYILNCNFFDYYSTEFKENPLSHSGKKDGIRK